MRVIPVEKIMSSPVRTIPADARGEEALREMQRHGVKKLLVVDGKTPKGVLPMWYIGREGLKKRVGDLPLGPFRQVPLGTPVFDIERDLKEFPAVFVVDPRDESVKGIVTPADLARAF